jgi:hypothetical protein
MELTPAPTTRVIDPSGVATHGVALRSAGQRKFRSARVAMDAPSDKKAPRVRRGLECVLTACHRREVCVSRRRRW